MHSFVQTTRKRRNLNEFPRCTTVLVAVWYIECWTCDRQVPGSNLTRGYSASTPTQRAIPQGSVNEYHWKRPNSTLISSRVTRLSRVVCVRLGLHVRNYMLVANGYHRSYGYCLR